MYTAVLKALSSALGNITPMRTSSGCSCFIAVDCRTLTLGSSISHKERVSEKEKKAVEASGQEGFLEEKALLFARVRGEWASLRCALRRRVGAARTLLLTDGGCRLHAVPEDRLEQVRVVDARYQIGGNIFIPRTDHLQIIQIMM